MLRNSERRTPFKDALVEWKEVDSPSIPVAELVFDSQDISSREREIECTQLRFSPGNYHEQHRPSGNMGRGRMFGYLASQLERKARDNKDVTSDIVDRWREGRYTVDTQNNTYK